MNKTVAEIRRNWATLKFLIQYFTQFGHTIRYPAFLTQKRLQLDGTHHVIIKRKVSVLVTVPEHKGTQDMVVEAIPRTMQSFPKLETIEMP